MSDVDYTLESYDRPDGQRRNPLPPVVCEQMHPLHRVENFDDSRRPFSFDGDHSIGACWTAVELVEMWFQLLQIYRLPETRFADGDGR